MKCCRSFSLYDRCQTNLCFRLGSWCRGTNVSPDAVSTLFFSSFLFFFFLIRVTPAVFWIWQLNYFEARHSTIAAVRKATLILSWIHSRFGFQNLKFLSYRYPWTGLLSSKNANSYYLVTSKLNTPVAWRKTCHYRERMIILEGFCLRKICRIQEKAH